MKIKPVKNKTSCEKGNEKKLSGTDPVSYGRSVKWSNANQGHRGVKKNATANGSPFRKKVLPTTTKKTGKGRLEFAKENQSARDIKKTTFEHWRDPPGWGSYKWNLNYSGV